MKLTHCIITENGDLHLRWMKDDGVPHRAVVSCGGNVNACFDAIDAHMVLLGMSKTETEDRALVEGAATREWTPAKVASRQADLEGSREI